MLPKEYKILFELQLYSFSDIKKYRNIITLSTEKVFFTASLEYGNAFSIRTDYVNYTSEPLTMTTTTSKTFEITQVKDVNGYTLFVNIDGNETGVTFTDVPESYYHVHVFIMDSTVNLNGKIKFSNEIWRC